MGNAKGKAMVDLAKKLVGLPSPKNVQSKAVGMYF